MRHRATISEAVGVLGFAFLTACQTWPTVRMTPGTTPVYEQFAIYSHRQARHSHYVLSGYMGDSTLNMSGAYVPPHEGNGPCLRVIYRKGGQMGWSGIYWQQPANNWGDIPGDTGFDLRGATRLTFWARGDKGGEKIHEVRVGGIVGRYPDSDVAVMGPIELGKDWKQYEIDLKGKDLRHIIAGFGFFMNKFENPFGAVFYMDDIAFDIPRNSPLLKTPQPVVVTAPTENTAETPPSLPEGKEVLPMPMGGASQTVQFNPEELGLRASFSSQLMFDYGQVTLRPEAQGVLNQVINTLKAYPKNNVLIEGHTDNSGSSTFNLQLSSERAERVRDYLIKVGGFNEKRFRVVGYGDTRPIADNKTDTGRTLNRRVEIVILKVQE